MIFSARNANLSQSQCDDIKSIAKKKNKSLLSIEKYDIEDEDLRNRFAKYQKRLKDIFNQGIIKNNPYNQSIVALSRKLEIFLDEIDQNEFMEKFVPINLKQNFLPTQIGRIFLDYRVKEYEEFCKTITNSKTIFVIFF